MIQDDTLPTAPAADAAPAESETSEAKTEVTATEDAAKTETEADPNAEGDEDGDESDDKPKKPSRYQRLKRERDALAAEVAQMRSRPVAAAADDQAILDRLVKAEIGEEPQEKDYADWFAYERALTAYETEKRIVSRDLRKQASQAKETQQRHTQDLAADYQDRQREARSSLPDFDKVMQGAKEAQVSPVVGQLIFESEKSAVIEYHLAKNPAELARLNAMSPLAAAKEMARLEDRLSLPNPKTATKAAPPISSPKGGAAPSVDYSKMSMEEYVAHRKKGAA